MYFRFVPIKHYILICETEITDHGYEVPTESTTEQAAPIRHVTRSN
jgi:hypothetical protein